MYFAKNDVREYYKHVSKILNIYQGSWLKRIPERMATNLSVGGDAEFRKSSETSV